MEAKEDHLREELAGLEVKLQDPSIYSDSNYPKIAKRRSELESMLGLFDEVALLSRQKIEAEDLRNSSDSELKDMAEAELAEIEPRLIAAKDKLASALTPQDPNNGRDVIIEIRGAAGGDEASLFAGELYRMYARWAENHGFKLELISESPNEAGGFKEIIFMLRGIDAYKTLKFEAGVHRVQRVPVTESQGFNRLNTAWDPASL